MHLKYNYHTHTKLCNHATGDVEDYVKKAIELQMIELGMSDHNPIPSYFMGEDKFLQNKCPRNMTLKEFETVYLTQLEEVKRKYQKDIKIYSGLECEFFPAYLEYYQYLKSKVDYLNLGIHFFPYKGSIVNSFFEMNYQNISGYAEIAVAAMKTGLYKIFAHPDVFMAGYRSIQGENEFDEAARLASIQIIEAAILYNVYLEINVNGPHNQEKYGTKGWPYPHEDFWTLAANYPELKIVIGMDAHSPEFLDNEDVLLVLDFIARHQLKILEKVEI